MTKDTPIPKDDRAPVIEGAGITTGSIRNQSIIKNRKFFAIVFALLFLTSGILLFKLGLPNKSVCNQSVIKESAYAINAEDLPVLEAVYKKFSRNTSYSEDQNCLYIETNYYLLNSDPKSARKSFEKLKKLINDGEAISSELDEDSKFMQRLNLRIIESSRNQKEAKSNLQYAPENKEIN